MQEWSLLISMENYSRICLFVQDTASFPVSQHAAGSVSLIKMHPCTLLPFFPVLWRHCLPATGSKCHRTSCNKLKSSICFSVVHISFLIYFVFTCVFVVQLNSLHSELATQMADSMVFPLIQFREKDLTGRATNTNILIIHAYLYKIYSFILLNWQ